MIQRKDLANAIRMLSIDAIQLANSGHPGAPMGMADIAEVLWREFLNHNPKNPDWINRDRFVLSNGHGSMLLYSLLHLTGYDLPLQELKKFRRLHSQTPGHPEKGYTKGVETTTGPLGQGIANAVGMAIAEKILAAQFNRPNYSIIDHYTYVFMGDGCMMEGISHEACSLAGTLKLNKLIAFYDDNGISIDGSVDGWFTDDTAKRFESYGWHVIQNIDGHDPSAIKLAISEAREIKNQPSLIICKTIIGFGSPNKAGSAESHGAPLGVEEVIATRARLNWSYKPFEIPKDIYEAWDATKQYQECNQHWDNIFNLYSQAFPYEAAELTRRMSGVLPSQLEERSLQWILSLQNTPVTIATRKASQNSIEYLGSMLPEYFGGSADLAPSNLTMWSGSKAITLDPTGNYIHYGVREFGMTAIANGIAIHGGLIPYTSTFLMFYEYACNAVRMAALMKIRQILVYTHDSIGLGEDGPTHQPVEQLAALRYTPNLSVWQSCDQVETAVAWIHAIKRDDGPTALILSRQNLPQQVRSNEQVSDIMRGGYILKETSRPPEIIFIATGSEVQLALEASNILINKGIHVRVVSMPSTDVFDQQDATYKEYVLPKSVTKRIAIEASISDYWYKYIGLQGSVVGMHSFGESAPASELFDLFGITVDQIIKKANDLIG
ncbi:transketolase [Providencia rettgeri]|nr:transketolase [Providencia rettgeri]